MAAFAVLEVLPPWGLAVIWGALAGSGLFLGYLLAETVRFEHVGIARVMAVGAGVLLGTVSVQMALSAEEQVGLLQTMPFLLLGATVFSVINTGLAQRGARHRKRCGGCIRQATEQDVPGSGQAIAVGTILDAVPEGLVLGVAVSQGMTPTTAVVAGFFLANIPEAISSSAGMKLAGRSKRYLVGLWTGASFTSPVAAGFGSLLFVSASPWMSSALEAMSAGLLLSMAVETIIPEATQDSTLFSGTLAVLGFALIAAIAVFA
jgi:zinc transporter, ZIP family